MKSIILLHGAIGAAGQLEPLTGELQSHFSLFTFNFSGHGQTDFSSSGFGIAVFAEELKQFITRNKLEQPHVFGYSMGGYVALHLASQQPDLMGTIITLGTKFEWSPEIAAKEVKLLDAKTISEKAPKFAEALKKRHGRNWEELLSKTAQMMTGLGNHNPLDATALSGIKNKVVIGLADKDNMVSLGETVAAFKALPNAAMYMLPGTKHPVETIDAKCLADIILAVCKG